MSRHVSDHRETTALISGGHFLSHLYLLAFPPLFPLLAEAFHANLIRLGISVSLIYLAQFLFQIPAGELVDRVGGKRILIGGLFLTGLSIGLVGLVSSYVSFLGLAFLSGIGQAPFHPADYALLDAVGESSGEGKRFSIHSFGGFVGFAAAPVLFSGLAALFNWHVALFTIGAVGVLYAIVLAVSLAPVHRIQLDTTTAPSTAANNTSASAVESLRLLQQPLVAGMFLFFLVVTIADTGIQTFTTAFAVQGLGLSPTVGNTALTAFLAVTAGGVLGGGWLADQYNPYRLIVVSLAWSAVVLWAGLSIGLGQHSVIVVWAAAGIGFGIALPARDRIINALSAAGDTGKSFGIVYTGLPIGGLLAPIVVGWIINQTSTVLGFAVVGGCFFGSSAIIFGLLVYRQTQLQPSTDSFPQ